MKIKITLKDSVPVEFTEVQPTFTVDEGVLYVKHGEDKSIVFIASAGSWLCVKTDRDEQG